MADTIFSKIQLPNLDKSWYKYGLYPVLGTQTASTNAWTGEIDLPQLYDGLTIAYYLPYAGTSTAATLNLTLADGTTTGPVNVYWSNNNRATSHYSYGSTILLTYWSAGSIKVNGTATTDNRWTRCDYNSDTIDRWRHVQIKAKEAVTAGNLIVGDSGGYWHLKKGSTAFDISYPILYASSNITVGSANSYAYLMIPFTVTTTQSITLTAYSSVFLKGTLDGSQFTPVSTTPLTQTIPTSEDGYSYMYIGYAYGSTSMLLMAQHPIYQYKNSKFSIISGKDILSITRSGTTFTANRADGSSFTFTQQDNDTKVTSAVNHYAPTTVSGQDKTASASGATAAWSIDVVKGVTLNTDGKGHVTGLSVTSGKIPANPNTNTTYTLSSGTNNGTLKLTPSSGSAQDNVKVTGWDDMATKSYVDGLVANATHFCGSFNASNGKINGGSDTLTSVAEKVGDMYTCDTAGTYLSQAYEVGDSIIFKNAVAASTAPVAADIISVEKTVSVTQTLTSGTKIGTVEGVDLYCQTNTDTKVTAVGNHYTPATDSSAALSASASGATAAWSIDVVKGVTLSRDAKGHVTGVSVTSGKIPANPNTDRYVNSAAFADDTTNNSASPVKMTLTRAGSDSATVTANIPKVSSSSAGVAPKGAAVSTQSQSTKFLREDGSWAAPSYTTNVDTKVTQTATTTNANYEVLLSETADNTTRTEGAKKSIGLRFNPGTSTLTVNGGSSGTTGGLALYDMSVTNYGIAMRNTTNSGKHGYVQGDWGIYSYMTGGTNRGWILRYSSGNVASVDGLGNAVFNGSLTLGGNTENTSGCRQEYNSTTETLDFIFVS